MPAFAAPPVRRPRQTIVNAIVRPLTVILILAWALPATAADSAVVLMYHRFGESRFPSTNIRVEQFEAHLSHLRDGDYSVIPLADVIATVKNGATLPNRAVAITIDDAYRSVYEVAFPLFKAYEFPFTVFVATDAVDQKLPVYMDWDQMREMAAQGVTFANHGATHDSLIARREGETNIEHLARARADVEKGWRRLTEELEPLPGVFALPYGEYDAEVASLLHEMGFISFGQQSGPIGPYSDSRALPRFPMAEGFGDLTQFRIKVASLPMPVVNVKPWDPVVNTVRPRIEVTLEDADARLGELACFISGHGQVSIDWVQEDRTYTVGPTRPLGKGRQRVNCTAPRNDGRYLWFSHPWIVQPQASIVD